MELRRGFRWALVASSLVGALTLASPGHAGDDGGLGAFFREQFGIGTSDAPPQPSYVEPEDRPVIVRPFHRRHVSRPVEAKIAVGPVPPVSIYEDRTLRPGDAVMTDHGIRVFQGGHSMPYTEADFAALTNQDGLPKQVEKALLELNKGPRT